MKYLIVILFTALFFSGCATRLNGIPSAGSTNSAQKVLAFQTPWLTPGNGGELATVDSLRPGDIILSSSNGIASVGIRLFTLAPVSHAAIYLGDRQIAEAVGSGIRARKMEDVLADEAMVVALRHPQLQFSHSEKLREFAMQRIGSSYNYLGLLLQVPFSLERRACELPLIPGVVRDFCIRGFGTIQMAASSNNSFLCSQFVLEAYRQAGLPITDADPRWISPADILHMREGDVSSVRIHRALLYVGHLKHKALLPGVTENIVRD